MEISVRLANPPAELMAKYTKKERLFFSTYAGFVLGLVSEPEVQGLVRRLIETEGIRSDAFIDLRIMMLPARPLNHHPTRMLHGSYNHDKSQISLYPLRFPRDWIRKTGYELFKIGPEELSGEARRIKREIQIIVLSTLVHEVLHVKFEGSGFSRYVEEVIVRKLEKKHMREWEDRLKSLLLS